LSLTAAYLNIIGSQREILYFWFFINQVQFFMGTHFEGSEKEVKTLNAFIKLMRASEAINNRLNRHLADVNLTHSQFGVMEALLHLGPLNQKALAQKLLKSGGNITLVIDNLEKNNWVERHRDPN